jgi:hypothetical protein
MKTFDRDDHHLADQGVRTAGCTETCKFAPVMYCTYGLSRYYCGKKEACREVTIRTRR